MSYWFSCFVAYSLIGFVLELVYTRLTGGAKRDRKCFLFSPLCPVYGFGALSILLLPNFILEAPVLLFLLGGLCATAVEYITALFYERGVGVRFWDYSGFPCNLSGRVCLLFSAFWGALACLLVYGLHPLLSPLLAAVPAALTAALFLFVAADSVLSLLLLHKHSSTDSLRWYAAHVEPS